MDDSIKQTACEIVRRYGPEVALDAKRFGALLKDLCPSKSQASGHLLIEGISQRIPAELLKSGTDLPTELIISRLAARLEADLGIQARHANWVVLTWALALGKIDESAYQGISRTLPENARPQSSSTPAPSVSSGALPAVLPKPPLANSSRVFAAAFLLCFVLVSFFVLRSRVSGQDPENKKSEQETGTTRGISTSPNSGNENTGLIASSPDDQQQALLAEEARKKAEAEAEEKRKREEKNKQEQEAALEAQRRQLLVNAGQEEARRQEELRKREEEIRQREEELKRREEEHALQAKQQQVEEEARRLAEQEEKAQRERAAEQAQQETLRKLEEERARLAEEAKNLALERDNRAKQEKKLQEEKRRREANERIEQERVAALSRTPEHTEPSETSQPAEPLRLARAEELLRKRMEARARGTTSTSGTVRASERPTESVSDLRKIELLFNAQRDPEAINLINSLSGNDSWKGKKIWGKVLLGRGEKKEAQNKLNEALAGSTCGDTQRYDSGCRDLLFQAGGSKKNFEKWLAGRPDHLK